MKSTIWVLVAGGLAALGLCRAAAQTAPINLELISFGSQWEYWDRAGPPGADWYVPAAASSGWKRSYAEFGYGEGDKATFINFGNDPANRFRAVYFRREFTVPAGGAAGLFIVKLRYDDGVVVYVNGIEVQRVNMPEGPIGAASLARATVHDKLEAEIPGPLNTLNAGRNVIAVSVHQSSPASSDLSFDLSLRLVRLNPPALIEHIRKQADKEQAP